MVLLERGGPMMWPLLALSLVAVALVVERAFFWARESGRPAREVLTASWRPGHGVEPRASLRLVLDAELRRLERRMAFFDTVIAAAPMMGILGTVLGVIGAFEALSGEASPDPLAVTGGISAALITTASGLVIALCVLFPYSYFRTRLGARLGELEAAAEELLAEPES
ncbi:MAG: MotA/TolQ/ExbB proton channel family protein [Planctomycetota bacterium]|nr:MotA/TolQ/ExbB proton channel family protein [Planctomycetota bacterium]